MHEQVRASRPVNDIDGVVITLTDLTAIKQMEAELRKVGAGATAKRRNAGGAKE